MQAQILVMMDTDVLISLLKGEAIAILGKLTRFAFVITELNAAEVRDPAQAAALTAAVNAGHLSIRALTDTNGLAVFARLRRSVDDGEAATIAQAQVLDSRVAMHDSAGRQAARGVLGSRRVYRLEDILVEAIREKVLTVASADAIAARLKSVRDYRMGNVRAGFSAVWTDANFGMGD